jgi:Ca-activated chloride channel family protein
VTLRTHVTILTITLLAAAGATQADGILITRPTPEFPKAAPLNVKYHRVNVEIKDQVATTSIDQVFTNPFDRQLEGTYIFPLPEDSAISDFAMFMDGKRVSGSLLEKGEARRIYDDIVRKMRDPALLEYVGRDMFKASVFPIPAKGEARIQIQYSEVIRLDNETCSYVYPLNTEKFSPEPLQECAVAVDIQSRIPIKGVYSPTHPIDVNRKSDREVALSFEEKDVKPDKDFVLYYTLSDQDFGLSLVTHRGAEEDGYFLLMLAPKAEVQAEEVAAKDIVFVFDSSGSMAGDKVEQAKSALKFCLSNLNARDRFDVITFSTGVKAFRQELASAEVAKSDEARKFVEDIKAIGGTNINEALVTALKMVRRSDGPAIIVFLTDGLPTVGETNEDAIVRNVADANEGSGKTASREGVRIAAKEAKGLGGAEAARVFVFGVGNDVNTHLLDRVSADNGGVSEYVREGEDIEVKVSGLYSKLSHPVLANLAIDFGDVYVYDYYPQQLPDLFKGSQLTLFGRYRGDGNIAVKLLGELSGKEREFAFDATFPAHEVGNDFIPRLWATRRIGYLLDEIRLKGENKELKDEIIALSTRFGIMTPYTSYLVTEDEEATRFVLGMAPALGTVRGLRQRLQAPQAMGMPGMMGGGGYGAYGGARGAQGPHGTAALAPEPAMAYRALREKSGEAAVSAAEALDYLKRDARDGYAGGRTVKQVGPKTFYSDGKVWYDAQYKDGLKTYAIKAYSDAYFAVLDQRPEWGKFLALGDEVALVIDGKYCIRVGAAGLEKLSDAQLKEIASLGKPA